MMGSIDGFSLLNKVNEAQKKLTAAGVDNAGYDVRALLCHAAGWDMNSYIINVREGLHDVKAVEKFDEYVEKRLQRIPLQHITGEADFYGLTFKVSEDVLIPRFDTEILVEAVIDYCRDTYKDKALQKIHMLDMCTGSGCIAITLAQNIKNASVAGSDISEAALEIAEENNEKYGRKVLFTKSDLFEKINGKFDVIVSNPPYIKSADIDGLMPEVRLHDPYIALDGKADGLEFIRKIAFTSVSFLNSNGALFFEIGSDEGNDTADIMKAAGFKNLRILKDLSGLDRVAAGNI